MKIIVIFVIFSILVLSFTSSADEGRDLQDKAEAQNIKLTEDDKDVLKNGELGTARYIVGGIIGTYPIGFGLGHVVQGRWQTSGWRFTAGELASVGVIIVGANKCVDNIVSNYNRGRGCDDDGLLSAGILGFVGFRIWEIIEVWYGGSRQMENYQYLKNKISPTTEQPKTSYFLLPDLGTDKAGIIMGMTF